MSDYISGYVSTRTSCYSCFGSAICGVSDHIGIYSYILFIPSGSSSLELGLRWVLTCLLCDRSKCAASVLRNWRYVTGPYQDSPFYETVDSTVCLASSWLSVHNSWYSWGFLMSLVFGNCLGKNHFLVKLIFGRTILGKIFIWSYHSWSNWCLTVPFWINRYLAIPFLGQIDVWSHHFGQIFIWSYHFLVKLMFGRSILDK